jgi:23S rRNA pseudouridine1911/1915/1917 synthase
MNSEIFKKIQVIFEDDNYLVINKPAGLVVHPDGRTTEASLTDWIIEKHPQMKDVGEPLELTSGNTIYRPGIVHRIDRETSGVLVIAKTQKSFLDLKEQFKAYKVNKTYHALIHGQLRTDEGVIDRPIGKSNKDFRLWSAQRGAKGKIREAITQFLVLEKFADFTYIEATPKTGRTHQIRVHFKAINHPLVCDSLYAPKKENALGLERLALHARTLSFKALDGQEMSFEAPLPEDFDLALKTLRESQDLE